MKKITLWLVCLMAAVLLPVAAFAAEDTVEVLFLNYDDLELWDDEYQRAAVNDSAAFMQWVDGYVSAEYQVEAAGEATRKNWMKANLIIDFTGENIYCCQENQTFYDGENGYPYFLYYKRHCTEEASIKAIVTKRDSGETFEIEWKFVDSRMTLASPEISGDELKHERYNIIYAKEGADLTIQMNNGFAEDSPVAAAGYHVAYWEPKATGEMQVLSFGEGAGVLALKANEEGTIHYTFGAVVPDQEGVPGQEQWKVSRNETYTVKLPQYSDCIEVLYVNYSEQDLWYIDSVEASLKDSQALMQWVDNMMAADLQGVAIDDEARKDWMSKHLDETFSGENIRAIQVSPFYYDDEGTGGGGYPYYRYDIGEVQENSSIKAAITGSSETFVIEWKFVDSKMRLVAPEISGDKLTEIYEYATDGTIFAKEGSELTIEMKDHFEADSPVTTVVYYEAYWVPEASEEKMLLSYGEGAGVLKLTAAESGTIEYTYGASVPGTAWQPGNGEWAVSTTRSLYIDIIAPKDATADYSETILFTPGFEIDFEEINGYYGYYFLDEIGFVYNWVWQIEQENKGIQLNELLDATWKTENMDADTYGFSWDEYGEQWYFPYAEYNTWKVTEDSRIECTLTYKPDPSRKLVVERKFKNSGLVPVDPTITGAESIVKINDEGYHDFQVLVKEGATLSVQLNDYFTEDAAAGPRRYHWFLLTGYQNGDYDNSHYWRILNSGWGTGSQELVIKPEYNRLWLTCYYGASYGPEPDTIMRDTPEPPYEPVHQRFDSAAVQYSIELVVEGCPSFERRYCEVYPAIGVPQEMSVLLAPETEEYKLFYRDYDGDGTITADELNQNISMTVVTDDDDIIIREQNGFTAYLEPFDGQIYIDSPSFVYEVPDRTFWYGNYVGEIVATLTNTLGDTYVYTVDVVRRNLVRQYFTIATEPVGRMLQIGDGYYQLLVKEGTAATFTPQYIGLYGEALDLTYEWWIYSNDLEDYTTQEPVCTERSFTVTELQDNCDYECKISVVGDSKLKDWVWTLVSVVPSQPELEAKTKIEYEAFSGTGITKVNVPEHVTAIESRAFANCQQLQKVSFPNTEIAIADDAFEGCSNVRFYVYSGTSAEKYAIAHEIPVAYIGE